MQDSEAPWFDAWRGIIFAHAKVFHAVERSLEEHSGIPLTFLDVLSRLYDAPAHRLRMQELQERSLFTSGGITRLIDRIEQAGLVSREKVPGDRRGVSVVLTAEGVRLYEEAFARHKADLEREFAPRLSMQEHRAVGQALAQFWSD